MSAGSLSFIHRHVSGEGNAAATTLLLLHGTGGNENDLVDLGETLLPGAALLSPRGKVLENGMPRFFRRLAEGVFDIDDLQRRTHQLADFVAEACEAYSLSPRQIVAVGYSNGANIAASTLLLRPRALAAAVLFRAMVPLVPKQLPDLSGKSILLSAGQHDPIANPTETRRLADLFSAANAAVETLWQSSGHELGKGDIAVARAWLRKLINQP